MINLTYLLKSKRYNYQADKLDIGYKLFETEAEMQRYQAETNVPAGITEFFVMKVDSYGEAMSLIQALDEHFGMGLF